MTQAKLPYEEIGEAFVYEYYRAFDGSVESRGTLSALYMPDSKFTFEEHKAMGPEAIKDVLVNKVQFRAIQHIVTMIDCQPTVEEGIIIMVTGRLKTDEDQPHAYSQVFYIKRQNASYFLAHDMFRLSLHNTI